MWSMGTLHTSCSYIFILWIYEPSKTWITVLCCNDSVFLLLRTLLIVNKYEHGSRRKGVILVQTLCEWTTLTCTLQ